MNTAQAKAQILAHIADTGYRLSLVAREQPSQAAKDAALERAAELFLAGYYRESARVLELARQED